MTARDAGGIACRVFAAYLATSAFRVFTVVLSALPLQHLGLDSSRVTGGLGPPILDGCLYAMAAAILWAKSSSFWPSEEPAQVNPQMDASAWLRLAFLILGTYFLMTSLTTVLIVILGAALQSKINWPHVSTLRAYEDSVQAVIALGLIIYGSVGWKASRSVEAE
jgi:hypothetical protein